MIEVDKVAEVIKECDMIQVTKDNRSIRMRADKFREGGVFASIRKISQASEERFNLVDEQDAAELLGRFLESDF